MPFRPWPVLALLCLATLAHAEEPPLLTIGSTAPALDVEHWFATEMADGGPITTYEPGKVYITEFWATWCGPCVASIPHIHELQAEYADSGLTVVSVTKEDTETVEDFFARDQMGFDGDPEEQPTYGELMKAYRVAADPDGSTSDDYMKAAAQMGIPTAFLIGKTGQIEWIGHPMAIDEPLAEVVADAWDREAFAKEFRPKQELDRLNQQVILAVRGGDYDKARGFAEKMLVDDASDDSRAMGRQLLQTIDRIEAMAVIREDPDKAVAAFEKLLEIADGNPQAILQITAGISRLPESGVELREDLLQAAADAAEATIDEDDPDGRVYDTLAHLYHAMGKLDEAIAHQERAVAAFEESGNPQLKEMVGAYLDELRAEKTGEAMAEEPAAGQ